MYKKIIFEDFSQDHELRTLGIKYTNPYLLDTDIARIIKVIDAKGRKHECILRILIILDNTLESDSEQGKALGVDCFFLSLSLIFQSNRFI
jgi:cystathionine beta-lyase/cystathionine gamma-synthase